MQCDVLFLDLITMNNDKFIYWQILPVLSCLYGGDYTQSTLRKRNGSKAWTQIAVDRLRIGLYSLHIHRWLKVFPAEQLLFLRLEDWSKNRTRILNERIFPFLDLPPVETGRIKTGKVKNRNWRDTNVQMMNKTRRLLMDFYQPFNMELSVMLNDTIYLWEDSMPVSSSAYGFTGMFTVIRSLQGILGLITLTFWRMIAIK